MDGVEFEWQWPATDWKTQSGWVELDGTLCGCDW